VQRCPNIVTATPDGSGPVASPRTGKRLGSLSYEQHPRTLHHRADVGPCITE
jgi:hypothetical protein